MIKKHSIHRRMLAAFALTTLLIALLFSLTTFLFAYHIEDRFFTGQLIDEAKRAEQQLTAGSSPEPQLAYIRYYSNATALPSELQSVIQSQPNRTEFSGQEQRHYHLQRLSQGYLLAEVSQHLMVRELRPLMLKFLLVLLLTTLLLSSGLAWLIGRQLLSPLQQLTALLDNTSHSSLPAEFAARFKPNEIGQLATALEQSWARTNAFIEREQLFTRDLSHELRTPVTISQGALSLLTATALKKDQRELVGRIEAAQQQIAQSMDTLLELAREPQPEPGRSMLLPMVEQSILQQHSRLAGKDIELELAIPDTSEIAMAEAPLLILLNNLLANAFSYTHSGSIHISYQNQQLIVKDSGHGIPAALQSQLFSPGTKGPTSQGLGMGLSIVSRLCEKWQLQYSIESSATGTCVRITFPLSQQLYHPNAQHQG
ncbi:sensor histidine kinase [Alkalimonas amylolytica]|uniref:histidine kinase n=1 Tax=Alkalimonas amylolytica TaxID=152573 RepID=A0A1H4BTE0_ALKAM|nr:HAMP domain-containing sensor histidine kinase [Alkalimonas amylolytica]SEA51350.1 Signal transduction histidine kinase [Alkalimonas amylolytica]